MNLSNNTVLITGGSSGIGLALAERFLQRKNRVIVCGRRKNLLDAAQAKFPALQTCVFDTGNADDRARMVQELTHQWPDLNVVINNAGIQRKINVRSPEPWKDTREEIAINLEGPIHLCHLFVPHLLKQKQAALMNVSSGLAFVPLAHMPVYCATKAALHSYTLSLRRQLQGSSVAVVEIIPPAVKSNLGGSHDFGVDTDVYADSVMQQLAEGHAETTFEMSAKASQASRRDLDMMFVTMNAPHG